MSATRYPFKNRPIRGMYMNEPVQNFDVELFVDWDKIIQNLGAKARRSKRLRSKLGIGIELRVKPSKVAA